MHGEPSGHLVSMFLGWHAQHWAKQILKQKLQKELARLFQFKVVSISQPRWPEMLWGRELIPGGKPGTWRCFSHDQQRPLDRLPFPFEEQGEAKAQETYFSLRDMEWLLWFWVLQRLSTDQDRQKQRIFRSAMKGRFILLEISHRPVSDCQWAKCLWLYLNKSPKNRAHLTYVILRYQSVGRFCVAASSFEQELC